MPVRPISAAARITKVRFMVSSSSEKTEMLGAARLPSYAALPSYVSAGGFSVTGENRGFQHLGKKMRKKVVGR
jgi:hypothetical protein